MSEEDAPQRGDGTFGTRYLQDEATIYEHNAWDNVEMPESKLAEIERIIDSQRATKVDDDRAQELLQAGEQPWNQFYDRNADRFFKDRKWLAREFPDMFKPHQNKTSVLEVGCGAGNTTFPLLKWSEDTNPQLFVYCCDFSSVAVNLVRANEAFDDSRCCPFVWNITDGDADIPIASNSLDYILCIYVLSAVPPSKLQNVVRNLSRLLKPGGQLYVKDYGRHDLTQLRFKKGRYIDTNCYARGDETLVSFFTEEELHSLFADVGLEKTFSFMDKRLLINRNKQLRMYRRWVQCTYRKSAN